MTIENRSVLDLRDGVNCDSVLTRDLYLSNESYYVRLSWLRTINKQNYEENRVNGSAMYSGYGLFDGSYEQFDSKRNSLLSEEKFELTVNQARQVLISRVSDISVNAWRDCVLAQINEASLIGYFDNITTTGGILHVRWKTGLGSGLLKNAKLNLPGATKENILISGNKGFEGEKAISIKRVRNNEPLLGTINGEAGAHQAAKYSCAIFLPEIKPTPIIEKYERDVGAGNNCTVDIPAPTENAIVTCTVTCGAIWNRSGDPEFSFNVNCSELQPWTSGLIPVFEGQPTRFEKQSFSFRLTKGKAASINATTRNNHADAKKLEISAKLTIG